MLGETLAFGGYAESWTFELVPGGCHIRYGAGYLRYAEDMPDGEGPLVAIVRDADENCAWQVDAKIGKRKVEDPSRAGEFGFSARPIRGEYKGRFLGCGEQFGEPNERGERPVAATLLKTGALLWFSNQRSGR